MAEPEKLAFAGVNSSMPLPSVVEIVPISGPFVPHDPLPGATVEKIVFHVVGSGLWPFAGATPQFCPPAVSAGV